MKGLLHEVFLPEKLPVYKNDKQAATYNLLLTVLYRGDPKKDKLMAISLDEMVR